MPFSLSSMAAATTLLIIFICHSLASPLTTWTPVDLKVDAVSRKGTSLDAPVSATYVGPSISALDIVMYSPKTSYPESSGNPQFLPSDANSPYSPTAGILSSLSQYHSLASVSKNVIMIFQLIFGAGASLCLILGLSSCLARLDQRRRIWTRHSHHRRSISIEMKVGKDVQILVVKTRPLSSGYPQGPSKSTLCSPERKASLGKSVRWADQVALASDSDLGCGHDRTSQDLLHQAGGNDASPAY